MKQLQGKGSQPGTHPRSVQGPLTLGHTARARVCLPLARTHPGFTYTESFVRDWADPEAALDLPRVLRGDRAAAGRWGRGDTSFMFLAPYVLPLPAQ